jgi:UDP-N-acetylglucosamine acyltransferase
VSDQAVISPEATIGAYCVIDGHVEIGAHTVVDSHARIGSRFGAVVLGEHNYVQSGAMLGGPPQDLTRTETRTTLIVGNRNRIGEYASISLGSAKGEGVTRIGDHNFIMAYAHVGHDCQLADNVIITNGSQLAGHVVVERRALISGLAGVTQFVRLGELSFLVAGGFANKDVLPYTIAEGHWATPRAVNRVGLRRAGFTADQILNIRAAVRILLDRKLTVEKALARIERECAPSDEIEHLVDFASASQKGIARA